MNEPIEYRTIVVLRANALEWAEDDIVLALGEPGLLIQDGPDLLKFGDGVSPFSELPVYGADFAGGGGADLTPEQAAALADVLTGRLAATARDVTSADLNSVTDTGNYFGYGLTNAPTADGFYVQVVRSATNFVMQRVTGFTGAVFAASWSRFLSNGAWSDWSRFDRAYLDGVTAPLGDGKRLGATAGVISAQNLNTVTDSGWYIGSDLVNSPDGSNSFWYVWVTTFEAANWVYQMARSIDGNRTYYRSRTGGTWNAWYRFDADKVWEDQQNATAPLRGRLASPAADVANADVNTLTGNGWYLGGDAAPNQPSAGRFVLLVSSAGDGYTHQRLLGLTGTLAGNEYTRLTNSGPGGAWTAWQKVADSGGAIDAAARVLGNGAVPLSAATALRLFGKDAAGATTGLPYGTAATGGAIVQRDTNGQVLVPTTPTADGQAASKAYVDSKSGTGTTKTRTAAYALGGSAASGSYGTQTPMVFRCRTRFTKKANRMRVHVKNIVGTTDATIAGTPTVTAAYFGRETAPNSPAVASTQTFPAGSGSLASGGEWVSGWLAPDWDTRVAEGRLTLAVNVSNTNLSSNYSVNAWYSGDPTALNSTTGWTQYGDCPLQTWIEWEYTDDGAPVGLFLGDSHPDGYFGGPWNQAGTDMQYWGGHVDAWPEAWGRKRRGVAMVNAYASSTATQWAASSSKWTRFDSAATPIAPDFIVIHIGANDLFNGVAVATIVTSVIAVINAARAKYPGVPVFYMGIMPILSGNSAASRAADRVSVNRQIANLGRGVIAGYLEPEGALDPASGASEFARAKYVSADGLHYTIQGHDVISDAVALG